VPSGGQRGQGVLDVQGRRARDIDDIDVDALDQVGRAGICRDGVIRRNGGQSSPSLLIGIGSADELHAGMCGHVRQDRPGGGTQTDHPQAQLPVGHLGSVIPTKSS